MTKVEYRKCEMLMEEAIREATDSNANYEEHVCLRKKEKELTQDAANGWLIRRLVMQKG